MPGINQFLPFGTGVGANVLSAADYLALSQRPTGYQNGIADATQVNTSLRQPSVAAAALAQFIVDQTGVDMLDNGSVNDFETKLIAALNSVTNAAIDASGSFGSGGIYGMILSNTPANPLTHITITTGQCRSAQNDANLTFAAPFTKRLDVAWTAGNGNGGRDAGALANGQTWHVFAILNPTTAAVDGLFSQSPTAPTLPAGFTKFRRLGSIMLEAAATTIRQFIQTGDKFTLKTRSTDYAAQANNGGPFLRKVTVPNGIKVEGEFYFQSTGTASSAPNVGYLSGIFDPDFGAPVAWGQPTQWAQIRRIGVKAADSSNNSYDVAIVRQFTDANQNVYTFSNDTLDVIVLGVLGWRDDRGRFF